MNIASLNIFANNDQIAWVGAGGKTSLMFAIANELFSKRCFVTTSTKMGYSEMGLAHQVIQIDNFNNFDPSSCNGITLYYKGVKDSKKDKIIGYSVEELSNISPFLKTLNIPLLIEADGSKRKPFKFPGEHEPNIPSFVNKVCVVVGLSAIGKPLSEEYFFRHEKISQFLDVSLGKIIGYDHLLRILIDPEGGLKNIPQHAERIIFLNQSDTIIDSSELNALALELKKYYDHVLLTSINKGKLEINAHWGKIGCVILAAGSSTRFGNPKQLALYRNRTFVENIIQTIMGISFSERIIVLGSSIAEILPIIKKYKVTILQNENWQKGQSESVKIAADYCSQKNIEALVFLTVDQPQISREMINNAINEYAFHKPVTLIHTFKGQIRHPVIFSKESFESLKLIEGDKGGRQLFEKFPPYTIEFIDAFQAIDVDTPEDLLKLNKMIMDD